MTKVLIAGESWVTTSIHTKGFDAFTTVAYEEGVADFRAALEASGHEVTFMPNHDATRSFPSTTEELSRFDVVVLSDIGANTLLLPNETFLKGEPRPNRLIALREWVRGGGALIMVGGYLSFQGIEAKANYRNTPLAEVLPVLLEVGDDREECPEGATPYQFGAEHPCTRGLPGQWPDLLGFQRLIARASTDVLAQVNGHPLLVVGSFGQGRTAAFASDIGPHWAPPTFTQWAGFATLWHQTITWLGAPTTSAPSADHSAGLSAGQPR